MWLVAGRRRLRRLRHRMLLEVAVEDDLVALLVGVDQVQHEGGRGFEPADVVDAAVARDDGEARRQVRVEARTT